MITKNNSSWPTTSLGPTRALWRKRSGRNQDIPGTVEAMKKYAKSYTYKIYPGAQHGFHSDDNPERYHLEAAKEARGRTLDFFKKNLQG